MRVHLGGLCFTDQTGMPFVNDADIVALSVLVAIMGSVAALEMAERLRRASEGNRRLWLAGSAVTLGGSIWATHFIGMLAINLRLPVGYDGTVTVLSLVLALGVVAAGLQVTGTGRPSLVRLATAGTVIGIGVAAMHYLGMAALLFPGRVAYRPGLWGVSVLIAVGAGIAALWLSITLRRSWHRAVAALLMAGAICGMHYTGMAATEFIVDPSVAPGSGIAAGPLAAAVAGATLLLVVLALGMVALAGDRRVLAAVNHEAEALRHANAELAATQREIVRRLCRAGEFRDSDTGGHVDRIGLMAHRLAQIACDDPAFTEAMLVAAPLHDIGKIGISDLVLLKPGKLDAQQWAEMRNHAEIGHTILTGTGVRLLDLAAEIARSHHEKWDGTGYPAGLSGEAIPLSGRIVAIVDVFDALLSRRPYKDAWPLEQVVEHMRAEAGRHFDPRLVAVFLADLPAMLEIRSGHMMPDSACAPAPLRARPVEYQAVPPGMIS